MLPKNELKNKAIELRKQGFSYSEIIKQISVAKSTLSGWLRDVGLSKRQKQKLTKKKLEAALRGGKARKDNRIFITKKIYEESKKDIGDISRRELWLMGVMLYWAEGHKEKEYRPGSGAQFTNSDPKMIRLFLNWLDKICDIKASEITFSIYIHENNKNRLELVKEYWADITGFKKDDFLQIYFKKGNIKTLRKNIDNSYFGVLRVKVKASSILQRKIAGWIKGVVDYFY
ncbi:MAG: hypothetical protein UU93_C0015G0002 [Candidatus Amesbacteria bacterium GW2011_GWA2_42_12]|uniref:Resolvase helix-turn-helix domain protein n=1 Tax=Candidatus Amesbacteria bacterium GW2011_GWA2_42_12 TaxID=1618356 RepID=A0A0G1B2D3_9BACT|nr:MAG: hypothetical protein UU93_C0015G0002 [Candidatus Amesbacteria bacterium GW2011_GWA2_42_12]